MEKERRNEGSMKNKRKAKGVEKRKRRIRRSENAEKPEETLVQCRERKTTHNVCTVQLLDDAIGRRYLNMP